MCVCVFVFFGGVGGLLGLFYGLFYESRIEGFRMFPPPPLFASAPRLDALLRVHVSGLRKLKFRVSRLSGFCQDPQVPLKGVIKLRRV